MRGGIGIGIGRGHGKGRPAASGPTVLFADDWTGDLSGYLQLDTAPGSCAIADDTLLVDSGPADGGGSAFLYRTFTASPTGILSCRCTLTIATWAVVGGGWQFLTLADAQEATVLGLSYESGAGFSVGIFKLDGSGYTDSGLFAIPDGAVVELVYDRSGAPPTGSAYVNGVLGASVTDASTANPANVAALQAWSAAAYDGFGGRAAFALGPVSVADGVQGV